MFFSRKPAGPVSWLIVGLGNMGDQYEHTRHNVGFDVIDQLADDLDIPVQRLKFKALTNTASLGGQTVLLMKPVTYMNLSGEAVRDAMQFYKLPPERTLILFDDIRSGLWTLDLLKIQLISIPFLLAGMFLGGKLYAKMSQQLFMKITYVLLFLSGVSLLVK